MAGTATLQSVRTQFATRIAAVVSDALRSPSVAAVESPEAPEFLRLPTRSPVHMEFAIHISTAAAQDTNQRPAAGVLAASRVVVQVNYQLPSKDRVSGMTGMLTIGAAVRAAILADGWIDSASPFGRAWVEHTHAAGPDGWIWLDETFTVLHRLPLA